MPICFGIGHIGRVGSVFVTMSVTIERYFAIVHPLKHFSGKRFLLVVPIVTTMLYNIPKFFEFKRSEVSTTYSCQVKEKHPWDTVLWAARHLTPGHLTPDI